MGKQRAASGMIGIIGLFMLILDSKTAFTGAYNGLTLCIQTLIPSLFPFFLFSAMLSGVFSGREIPMLSVFGKWFHIPKGAEHLLLSSFLGGYPVGAQSVYSAYRAGSLSKEEAQRLLAYCSNAGPAFIFGVISQMFDTSKTIWILWGIHILSAWMVSNVFPQEDHTDSIKVIPNSSVGLPMNQAVKSMGLVCGWVILFRVIIEFLNRWFLWLLPGNITVAVIGLLELSNGCCMLHLIENNDLRFLVCSGILAFGGVCVTMQTLSIIEVLSPKNYLTGKVLQVIFSILLSLVYLRKTGYVLPLLALLGVIFYGKFKKISRNPEKAIV